MLNLRSNSIKDILNRGILVSLCLSTLVGSIVVTTWQGVSKIRAQSYQESLVREVIHRDASDLITSFILKNYDGVVFQIRNALENLPVHCAYLQFPDNVRAIIGDLQECQRMVAGQSKSGKAEVSSKDFSFGPLYYVVRDEAAPSTSYSVLTLALLALVCSMGLTWGILLHFLNRSILKPLQEITTATLDAGVLGENETNCDELNILSKKLGQYHKKLESDIHREEFIKIASQVAHDVRSPLTALSVVENDLSELPEDRRLMVRSAINRIQDIANNLLQKNRELMIGKNEVAHAEIEPQLLSSLIDPIITEKRMQFRSNLGVEIDSQFGAESYGLFAKVDRIEFRRIISNLINNSVEALADKGKVSVSIAMNPKREIEIVVADNGPGVPPDILMKLGQRGESYGKANGSGLGLYHARNTVESWNGRLEIKVLRKGTRVHIFLPSAVAPSWFVSEIKLVHGTHVVVLDDDNSIHQIWQSRFDSVNAYSQGITVSHFSSPDEFRNWVKTNDSAAATALFFVDYELLEHRETGLKLIEELKLSSRSILVSSRVEEKEVLQECFRLKVQFIPKWLAGLVPISFAQDDNLSEFILIDNDELIHQIWKTAAKKKGRNLALFTNPNEFLAASSTIDRDTPVYVDVNLGWPFRGDQFASTLFDSGFTNIYLSTGEEPEKYSHLSFLKGVHGKEPPL